MLVVCHAALVGVTQTPELEIDEEEGDLLARATANLAAQFDVRIDPKTQAIVGMIVAAGRVYGPRAALIKMRKAQEKKERSADPVTGVGSAGVYGPNGEPMGTTEFVSEGPLVWPPNGQTN